MRLSRLLVLIATLVLTCASAQAHVGEFGSAAESARRGFLPELGGASRDFARVTAGRVWKNYDCAAGSTSALCVDAFGVEIARQGTTPIEHLYRGEAFDPNTGLYYLRARWMNPSVGRFSQLDLWAGDPSRPITLNKMLYADGDPVNRIDPSGFASSAMEQSVALNISAIMMNIGVGVAGAGVGILTHNRISNIVSSRAAARACAASYANALRNFNSGDCPKVRMPIVFMSETRMPGIGEHVALSQSAGSPAILNRTALLNVTNRLVATAKCVRGMSFPVTNSGTSCDEYPFASSYQGGIGSTTAMVPWRSNLVQGGVLSGFYSACLVQPDVFPLNEFLVVPVMAPPSGANFQCRFFGAR